MEGRWVLLEMLLVTLILLSSGCVTEETKPEGKACMDSGGTITTGNCCGSVGDYPDLCDIGACGCAPWFSHQIKLCDCGENRCWDSTQDRCVERGKAGVCITANSNMTDFEARGIIQEGRPNLRIDDAKCYPEKGIWEMTTMEDGKKRSYKVSIETRNVTIDDIENIGKTTATTALKQDYRYEGREMPLFRNEYSVIIFDDGSECLVSDNYYGSCKKGQCKKVLLAYDCTEREDPSRCTDEEQKLLYDTLGNRSRVITNEKDYGTVNWPEDRQGRFLTWCCKIKTLCTT